MVERDIVEIARRELGESGGGKYVEKETWWWDQQVQEAVKAKKEAFKNWRTTGNEVDKEMCKEHRKTAKISVTKGKYLKRFNKIAIQGAPQMAVDKEAISLSRVYSYYSKCNLPLFYV